MCASAFYWTLTARVASGSVMRGVRFLQVSSEVHKEGEHDAHHDERAHAQDQKPPDHPHSRLG
jgi:hypothetical protein